MHCSSDVTNKSSDIWPSGNTVFLTTVRHIFTSDGQMPDDLSVQTICSSTSVPRQIANNIVMSMGRLWISLSKARPHLFYYSDDEHSETESEFYYYFREKIKVHR